MIGGFPAKICEFEIYNIDGLLSLNGKEVEVYRGLDIEDNKTVWIPMGLFAANDEDITNNSTKRTIQFKGTDRTRLFDVVFTGYTDNIIPKGTSMLRLIEKICTPKGLTIDPTTQSNVISYSLKNDIGLPDGTTDRQVISWIAELGGCIPIISRDGKYLCFTRPSAGTDIVKKSQYKALSAEPKFGPINALSIGHSDYEDAYVVQDDSDIEVNGICEWQINDNSLAENDRKNLAELAFKKIKGMKIVPFSLTEFVDDYVYDINDGILIEAKDGSKVSSYILGINTTSRIRSTFKASTQDSSVADRTLAGSVRQDIMQVKLSVDHVENKITALVKESDKKYTQFEQTVEGIKGEVVDLENGMTAKIEATAERAELAYSKSETVEGQIEGVTDQITSLDSQVTSINSELEGLDDEIANKVSTEVQKDTVVEILAGKVSTKISGNYVTKSDYDSEKDNWLLKTTYESDKTQTDQSITDALTRVSTLENAGYITEDKANSLISQSADSISLSVEKSLKIGARNILLDSACFESFTPFGRTSSVVVTKAQDTSVPSGYYKNFAFTPTQTIARGVFGFYFKETQILGQSTIDKIKPDTVYTLSFWMKYYDAGSEPGAFSLSNLLYVGDSHSVSIDSQRSTIPDISTRWQKYTVVFTTPSEMTCFWLRFFFTGCTISNTYWIRISSVKLEEGNIATDWSPSAEDVEQSVNAKIELCVKTDDAGKLASKIIVESNMLEINTDNFTLAEDGTMTCKNGVFQCGNDKYNMTVKEAKLVHTIDGDELGHIGVAIDRNGELSEELKGTNSVTIAAGDNAAFQFDKNGSINNGWTFAGTEIFSGYRHYRQFTDTALEVLTCATGIYSDKTLGIELYSQQSKQIECAIKVKRENYETSTVTLYGFKQYGSEYITSPGLSLRTDGLYYNGKKLAYA